MLVVFFHPWWSAFIVMGALFWWQPSRCEFAWRLIVWRYKYTGLFIKWLYLAFLFQYVRYRNKCLARFLMLIVAALKFQREFGERHFNLGRVNHASQAK